MKLLTSLIGVLATVEVYFATSGQLGLNAGIGFLLAAPFAGLWAYYELVRKGIRPADSKLRARRELVFGYECLIIGSANALAGPHVLPVVATAGAAILACGQSLIVLLVFKNPRILQPVERTPSLKNVSVRAIVVGFFYVGLGVVGCAIFVPRSAQTMVRTIPIEFQWPGIALLFAAFGCLALGLASDHSRGTVPLYLAVVFVVASSVAMELVGRQNWYFLAVSLLAFLSLVPGWPQATERGPSDPSLNRAAQQSA